MIMILQLVDLILSVVFFIMIVHIIMSWLINFNVLNLSQPLVYQIWDGLNRLLEPLYAPVRRILPNTGALDLAPLVVFIAIIAIRDIIIPGIARSFMM
ncbi:YggT family protein [Mangrovicoccus sp. HB161399]|uniref:YggT family protein n=1 Tax=Mangrovicoccus sp. HB161399 TaxID=2720392 RepID=UPI001554EA1A|nr:YggT family protein [Mangrovicoccus sp. HB161399]